MLKFVFGVVFVGTLFGAWQEHLRPCLNKGKVQAIEGVDYLYMINLACRPDKLARSLAQLKKYNIVPYRFDAIYGWDLFKNGYAHVQNEPFSPLMNPGRVGCLLSHLSVLQDAYDAGYETIWVMEDDIDVQRDPHTMSEVMCRMDVACPVWDILYTDVETKNRFGLHSPPIGCLSRPGARQLPQSAYKRREVIDRDCERVRMRFGCYSMVVRRSGIEKILRFFTEKGLSLPIDNELPHIEGLKQVNLRWDCVTHLAKQQSNTVQAEEKYQQAKRRKGMKCL